MQITISLQDDVLVRFGNRLAALGEGQARLVMARALNHEGEKGRTQVKKVLVTQTGIKYGLIHRAVKSIDASPGNLTYIIEAKGDETNLGLFGAKQRNKGVSAAPWGKRRIFKKSFLTKGKLVYVRETKARYPIKPLFGPNIARELVQDESAAAFKAGTAGMADRIGHEIEHLLR